jgi:hypothetical protein
VYRPDTDQPTNGDSEPLLDGLAEIAGSITQKDGRIPVLVVLSGADVDQTAYVPALGKKASIEDIDLNTQDRGDAIFAQVTPEPGSDLRAAMRKLRGISRSAYVDYSAAVGDGIASELEAIAKGGKDVALEPKTFSLASKAANRQGMIAFLPRVLTVNSALPPPQAYAAQADWYAVRVWVTLDNLTLKEEAAKQ